MGQRGGKRENAGRRPTRVTSATREAQLRYLEDGLETPLDYMMRVMRDKRALGERRDDMAKAAAPYLHHKLSSIELVNDPNEEDGFKLQVIKRVIVKTKK